MSSQTVMKSVIANETNYILLRLYQRGITSAEICKEIRNAIQSFENTQQLWQEEYKKLEIAHQQLITFLKELDQKAEAGLIRHPLPSWKIDGLKRSIISHKQQLIKLLKTF